MDDFDYVPGFVPSPFTTTAAPKLTEFDFPEIRKEEENAPAKQPKQQPKASARLLLVRLAAFVGVAATVLGMLSSVIWLNKSIVANNAEIASLEADVSQAQAENVRLNALLSAMFSADKVQEYATSVLGMQKAERYQIHYFEDRDGDEVVIADGKAQNADMQE